MKRIGNFIKTNWERILLVIAIVVAFAAWVHPFNAENRGLNVAVQQSTELVASSDKIKKDSIVFTYEGEQVPNLISVRLRFQNVGNQPISDRDFVEYFSIYFPNDTRVVNQSLTQVQPLRSKSVFQQTFLNKVSDNQITFKPVLINPNEIFDLDILTTRRNIDSKDLNYKDSEISFEYNIVGISKVDRVSKIETNSERQLTARDQVKKIGSFVLIGAILIGLLLLASVVIPKFFPKKRLEEKKERTPNRLFDIIFPFAFLGPIILFFLYYIYMNVHDAWFLVI